MHLKQLKLAGFKSFVDPTIVPFPSQLVAVVGPNGCGKSNIIDAVRWVMGESSAKNLRGEAMTDVIFNGSSHRKAVGQASIELVFDNSLGRLTGQFASYQEIAVRRLVTRDGESTYFLNGSRCRRRDITDIFLGTGAGARGYSIIGQGTISRLIEARPEELRVYLEEAAGISKYKERRRETVLRIDHTRENLLRLADLRDELAKQLQRLERQAKAATRYKTLKEEERLCKAEILAIKWRSLTHERVTKQNELNLLRLDYEKHQTNMTLAYRQSIAVREKLQDTQAVLQQDQAIFYQLATEIARLEQTIQQQQRETERLRINQQDVQLEWQNTENQLREEKRLLASSEANFASLRVRLEIKQTEFTTSQQLWQEKQDEQADWLIKFQQAQTAYNKAAGEIQVEELRLQHLIEQRQQLKERIAKISDEFHLLSTHDYAHQLTHHQNALIEWQNSVKTQESHCQKLQTTNTLLRQQLLETEKEVHQTQDNVHQLSTEQARLAAALQTALSQDTSLTNTGPWLNNPRLLESITVEQQWQLACEIVLAEGLQAIIVDSMDDLWTNWACLQNQSALFVTPNTTTLPNKTRSCLSDKITGIKPHWLNSLDKIYTAFSLDEAIALCQKLDADESVITREGYWLGNGWVKIAKQQAQSTPNLLQRQEKLKTLQARLVLAQKALTDLREKRDDLHNQVNHNEQQLNLAQRDLTLGKDELRRCEAAILHHEQAYQQANMKQQSLIEERDELDIHLEELHLQQEKIVQLLTRQKQHAKQYEQEQHQLNNQKSQWDKRMQGCQSALEEARASLQQNQLEIEREKLKIQQTQDNLTREQNRLAELAERLETITLSLLELETPDRALHANLQAKIQHHSEQEAALTRQRDCLNHLTSELESLEATQRAEEQQAKIMQEKIQQAQMQEQALTVRAEGILETLGELNEQIDKLVATIPADLQQDLRERQLQDIVSNIKRLGAINLAAIEEYSHELQRKQHLDRQYDDLAEALATLEAAIVKLDKETQHRLRETFDEVNSAFQALFPRLFGGGSAQLEFTCDNLLEAGILVRAQPPGKRNSTIHLLSGGEKAMTAVALVFAIFQLNPSPFCMLDEVDAPLDDMNVGRFCELVKEMSKSVQFLFITHNKVTMAIADHLIGVTMREPGVSRVVAVDVDQALAMSMA